MEQIRPAERMSEERKLAFRHYLTPDASLSVSALRQVGREIFDELDAVEADKNTALLHLAQALAERHFIRTERDAAIAEQDALRAAVKLLRKDLEKGFGGMHPTSALWSNHPYDKGHNNALSTAITKFDFHLKKLLEAQSNGTK